MIPNAVRFGAVGHSDDERLVESIKMIDKSKRILDIGCYGGELGKNYVNEKGSYYGIDLLPEAKEYSDMYIQRNNMIFETRDFLKNKFPSKSFDYVIFLETIEHVYDPISYLKEIYNILEDDGYLILSTPNAVSLKNILYSFSHRTDAQKKKLVKQLMTEKDIEGTQLDHKYNWDFVTLARLLERSGFEVIEHKYVRSGPIQFKIYGKTIRLLSHGSKIFDKLGLQPLKVNHLLKARKIKR